MTLPKSLITITPLSKILAAVLFVLLPFLGFYLGMEYEKRITPNLPEPATIRQPTKITSSDPTAGWKTYSNNQFGFELQVPSTWQIEENNPIHPFIIVRSPNNSSELIISPITEARYTTGRNRDKKLGNGSSLLFAGHSAHEYREDYDSEFESVFIRDIQIDDTSDLTWTKPNEISYWIDKSHSEYLKTFDQILSTFRFINN